MSPARTNLAAVPGITVGHTTIEDHGTGCTVVLGPETGLRAAVCAEGRVGVGRGATCGKAAGLEKMVPAGLGSWAARFGDVIVSALVVVNAIGDVRNARGDIIGGSVDSIRYLAEGGAPLGDPE